VITSRHGELYYREAGPDCHLVRLGKLQFICMPIAPNGIEIKPSTRLRVLLQDPQALLMGIRSIMFSQIAQKPI